MMLQLAIQLLTLLVVFALACFVVYEMRRARVEQDKIFTRMADVLQVFASKFTLPRQDGDSAQIRPFDSNLLLKGLETNTQGLSRTIDAAMREIMAMQQESLSVTKEQGHEAKALLLSLTRQQQALEALVNVLREGQAPAREPQINRRQAIPPELPPSPSESTASPSPRGGDAKERFENLHRWVRANLQNIMQRGICERSQPGALLMEAPAELKTTGQILDEMILLVGTENYGEKLALVLPVSYVGSRYYTWFDIPKGTNERVEGTVEPAIVEQIDNDFKVIKRGLARQN